MKYKLLVLDLDGTLTNKQKKITPHTKETLLKIQEQGVKIVLASGRPTYGIAPLAEQLELQKYEGYILAYNGGEIIDWKTKELMYKNLLAHDVLPYLYECAKKNDFAIVTYDGEYVLTEKPDDEYVLKEALLNVMKIKKVDNFLDAVKHPIAKCLIVGEPTRLAELEKEMYIRAAVKILKAIAETRADFTKDCDAIVQNCTGAYHDSRHHFTMVYADYYFIEALYKLTGTGILLW